MKKSIFFRGIQALFLFVFSQALMASGIACFDLHATTGSWSPRITITNHCGKAIDLQNAIVEFNANQALSGNYWGDFDNLAYPQTTTISSESNSNGYLVKMALIFPTGGEGWEPKTTIDDGATIKLQFSATPELIISNPAVFSMSPPDVQLSKIVFNTPANPTQDTVYPQVTLTNNNGYSKVLNNISWSSSYVLIDVPYGDYDVKIASLKVGSQTWQGIATPSHLSLNDTQGTTVNINYQQVLDKGQVRLTLNQTAPESTINSAILVSIKNETTGQMLQDALITWNQSITLTDLNAKETYRFSTSNLQGKNTNYYPVFSPTDSVTIVANQTQDISLSYNGVPIETQSINASINGLPTGVQGEITAVDNYSNQYTTSIQNGDQILWSLPVNRQYQVTAKTMNMNGYTYTASVTPSSFLLSSAQSMALTVDYQKQANVTEFSPYVDVTLNNITKWDNATQSMQPVGLLDLAKNSGVKGFHLAFVTGEAGCKGTWAGYPVSTDATAFGVPVFKQLKAQGVSLTVALGGLSGQYLAQVCTSVDTLTAAYEQVITAYNPDTLDFDIENNMQTNNKQLDRLMQTLKIIKNNHPSLKLSFTLPVMPTGLVSGVGENVIKRAAANGLSDYSVNIMAMDYGPSFTAKTMGNYAIDAATNTFKQLKALYPNQSDQTLWHRIGVTPMIGLNDTIPLNFSLGDVSTLKQFAQQKQIGLLSFWSINRDHPCNSNYVSITCSSNNPSTKQPNQQTDYQYSLAFMSQ